MNYWIFKANPDHYRIDDRLLDPDSKIIWRVTRYHDRIQKGDTVFIWRAGTPRGVCAEMKIDECPYQPEEKDLRDGFELPAGNDVPAPAHWAKGTLIQRFPVIEAGIIKKIPGLELFSFFSAFQQATNFSITRPEGARLLEFIEKYQAEGHEKVLTPTVKARKPESTRATGEKKKPLGPTKVSSDVTLLKCEACGRYVVSSDTDRHIHEAHGGQSVEWKKTK